MNKVAFSGFLLATLFIPMLPSSFAQSPGIVLSDPFAQTANAEYVLSQLRLNSGVLISVRIENKDSFSVPYIAILEVRDKDDNRTVYLEWQDDSVAAYSSEVVAAHWLPTARGEFYLRSFLISDLPEPTVLAPAVQSEIVVGLTEIPLEPPVGPEVEEPDLPEGRENLGQLSLPGLRQYALDMINEDRFKNGVAPVALSDNIAAQAHAEDLHNTKGNSSHWTSDGMKPYMRYTVYGGLGAVAQNVHAGSIYPTETIESCKSGLSLCDTIDMTEMLELSQYAMMYDDEECCDNGHRNNILDPSHTHVSIGLAYDNYYFAYVQNFEDIYVEYEKPISVNEGYVEMSGKSLAGNPSLITVYYDEYPSPSIYQRDKDQNFYDYGRRVAYVLEPAPHGYEYSPPAGTNLFEANRWSINEESFKIEFNLSQIMRWEGRGVYNLIMYVETEEGIQLGVTTYSIFKE